MEAVRAAYGERAGEYASLFGSIEAQHPDDLELVERYLLGLPGPVADVGCGPGHITAHLRARGSEAIGFDPVAPFLAHARASSPGTPCVRAALPHLPVRTGALSGAMAWYSLIHLAPSDIDAALSELRRVLAPGGSLVVGFFDGERVEPFDHKVVTAWFWPIDELAARIERAGFGLVERQQRPGEPYPGPRAHASIAATVA